MPEVPASAQDNFAVCGAPCYVVTLGLHVGLIPLLAS